MNLNIFRANDIRGVYGKDFDDDFAYETGRALVKFLKCSKIIIGRDMRTSSNYLLKALSKGINDSGCDVIDIGLIDTPGLYFASGFYKMPGIMITASHNPAKYNGIKIVDSGAKPIDAKNGLDEIKEIIAQNDFVSSGRKGKVVKKDIMAKYRDFLLSFARISTSSKFKVVVDAGNGMAGKIVPFIYRKLPVKIIPLYFKLDGKFPNHIPNPIIKKNLASLIKRIKSEKADFGIAFDGDMDRVVFADENGKPVNTSITGALLIKRFLRDSGKKQGVIYTSACSKIVPDTILEFSGKLLREKVGHAFIKARMRKENALFGIEHSGHYYYKDNYHADSALITSLLIMEEYLTARKNGKKFSEMLEEFEKYAQADEVSVKLKSKGDIIAKIEKYYSAKSPSTIDHFDGLIITFNDYWFNVRKSNTEPLLRVNLEANKERIMKEKLKEILRVVKA